MPYTINKSDTAPLAVITDNTINNTDTSLVLIGKNYTNYGEYLNENFVFLTENFANSNPPSNPMIGQIYYDTGTDADGGRIFVCISKSVPTGDWRSLARLTSNVAAPTTGSIIGELWFDSANSQLKIYDGSSYITVGPDVPSGGSYGNTGAKAELVKDNTNTDQAILSLWSGTSRVAVISNDQFTINSSVTTYPGFSQIVPGITLASTGTISGIRLQGTASNADLFDNLNSTDFLRANVDASTSANLTINGSDGLYFGSTSQGQLNVTTADNVQLVNQAAGKNLYLRITYANAAIGDALTISGTNGRITVLSDPTTPLGVATKSYVDNVSATSGPALRRDGTNTITGVITPQANNTTNFGSTSLRYANVYANLFVGTSTQAQYADVAERFEADSAYPPGTVVCLGGPAEITAAGEDLSEDVFGVISSRAAHLMNAAAGTDETHPAVALTGRVPVRVTGRIKKGDRLVSAGNGLARAGRRNEITPFNVIGRALESKTDDGEGTIEAVVMLNS